jgi:hypothetical protein
VIWVTDQGISRRANEPVPSRSLSQFSQTWIDLNWSAWLQGWRLPTRRGDGASENRAIYFGAKTRWLFFRGELTL